MKKYTFTEEELKEMQKHEWAFNAYISKKNFDNGAFTCQIWFAAIDEYAKKNNIMPVCRRAPGEPIEKKLHIGEKLKSHGIMKHIIHMKKEIILN